MWNLNWDYLFTRERDILQTELLRQQAMLAGLNQLRQCKASPLNADEGDMHGCHAVEAY